MWRASMIREKVPWKKGEETEDKPEMFKKESKLSGQPSRRRSVCSVSWGGSLYISCLILLSLRKWKNILKSGFLTCFFILLIQEIAVKKKKKKEKKKGKTIARSRRGWRGLSGVFW